MSFSFLTLNLLAAALVGRTPANWQEKSRFEDDENFYYVGISSASSEKRKAYDEAYMMAVRALITEHFGRSMTLSERLLLDSAELQINQQVEIESLNINLQGLRVVDEIWSSKKDLHELKLLLAYPKNQRDFELKRQQTSTPPTSPSFNRHRGRATETAGGTLRVTSFPPGAEVLLDGKMIGLTALEATHLPVGLFNLEVRKENYLSHQTQVLINPGGASEVMADLKSSHGRIEITLSPVDAKVDIEGEGFSLSDAPHSTQLPSGVYRLTISHPSYLTKTEEVRVVADTVTYRSFALAKKSTGVAEFRPSDELQAFQVRVTADVSKMKVTFFSSARFVKTEVDDALKGRVMRFAPEVTHVLAESPGQYDILMPVDLTRGEVTDLRFDFGHQSNPHYPRPHYKYFDDVKVESNLYPFKIQFFDAEKLGSLHESKGFHYEARVSHPYRVYQAFGPNGEQVTGMVDYTLTPLRVQLRFTPTLKTLQEIEEAQQAYRSARNKEVLSWVGYAAFVAALIAGGLWFGLSVDNNEY